MLSDGGSAVRCGIGDIGHIHLILSCDDVHNVMHVDKTMPITKKQTTHALHVHTK